MPTTDSNHGLPVCGNVLNRGLHTEKPCEKWVSDIIYLRTSDAWLYLTVILDIFDRKIIGWALNSDMETVHTAIPAVEAAFAQPEGVGGFDIPFRSWC
jgi:transposase InsO family protein